LSNRDALALLAQTVNGWYAGGAVTREFWLVVRYKIESPTLEDVLKEMNDKGGKQ